MRKMLYCLAAVPAVALLAAFPPWGTAHSQPPQDVIVTNLPAVVNVEGKVSVLGTVRQSEIHRRLGLIVPPVERHRTSDVVEVEGIATDRFTGVTLSLHGAVRGTIGRAGEVGAVLVPDEESVLEMLREKGAYHFPIEVKVSLKDEEAEANFNVQRQFVLGFPKYRVYLYNATDRTVDLNLYAYLTQ